MYAQPARFHQRPEREPWQAGATPFFVSTRYAG